MAKKEPEADTRDIALVDAIEKMIDKKIAMYDPFHAPARPTPEDVNDLIGIRAEIRKLVGTLL